jgi:hypothetical protein
MNKTLPKIIKYGGSWKKSHKLLTMCMPVICFEIQKNKYISTGGTAISFSLGDDFIIRDHQLQCRWKEQPPDISQ